MLEQVIADAPDTVDAHVQLATAYNRLKRKDDANREREIVDRLNRELQAKQRRDTGSGPRPAPRRRRPPASRPGARRGDATRRAARRAHRRHRLHGGIRPPRRRRHRAKPAPTSRPAATAGPSQFDEIVKPRRPTRKAEQWEQAIDLYGKAVKLRPGYMEGIWYQGTAYYSLDKFAECRDAFRRVDARWPRRTARPSRSSDCASSGSRTTTARCSTW